MDQLLPQENSFNPEVLRELLFEAIMQGDEEEFVALCNEQAYLIFDSFEEWTRIPDELLQHPEAVNAYANCLMIIAQSFNAAGYPDLLTTLMGDSGTNMIEGWVAALNKSLRLNEAGRYEESNRIALQILNEMQGATGSAIDQHRPKIYGVLGTNFFQIGDFEKAEKYTTLALQDCIRTGDREGVAIYTAHLETILASAPASQTAGIRARIAKAQDCSDQLRYAFSNQLLTDIEADIEKSPGLVQYRAKVYGLLGLNYFRLGDLPLAKHFTELALHNCRANGDEKGELIYSENIRVISERITNTLA